MKQLSLGVKLIIFFLLVGLIPFGIIGVTSYVKSSNALSDAAYGQLKGMRAVKKAQITQFFDERQGDLGVLLETVATLQEASVHKLEAVHTLQKEQIETFFKTITKDASMLSRHRKFQDSFAAYDQGFNAVDQEKSASYKTVEAKYQKFFDLCH